MNNPKPMQNSELNDDKVLCCCYFVQKYIELDMGKNKEGLEDIAHDKKNIETSGVPVIDATASNVKAILQEDGTITRKSTDGKIIESTKSPTDVKNIKKLQDINNNNKLNNRRREADDKEI